MARTHTKFFDDAYIDALKKICVEMSDDLEDRSSAIDEEPLNRAKVRLSVLTMAIELCAEDVD